jgi:hypothetical protein
MPRQVETIDEEESTFRTEDNTIPRAKPKSRAVEQPPDPMEGIKTTAPKKRVQTEKQKENFQKALSALKQKRESQKKAQEEEAEMLKAEKDELKIQEKQRERFEKAKYQKKKLPPPTERPTYITAAELQKFKLEMLDIVKPVKVVKEREVEVEKVVEKPVVVEKVVEKPMTKIISGNELLDRIFFNK